MKLKLTVELEIKGVSRTKLVDDLWEDFEGELDGNITDTYFLTDPEGNEKEVEVNVLGMEVVAE